MRNVTEHGGERRDGRVITATCSSYSSKWVLLRVWLCGVTVNAIVRAVQCGSEGSAGQGSAVR